MPDMIRDGKGQGYLAHVNKDQQLVTRSVVIEQRLKSTLSTNYYEMTTGKVTLTDANETGLIYIKNSKASPFVMVIDRFFLDCWASTGGSGGGTIKYYKDVTITGGTAVTPTNTNYGVTAAAEGTFSKSLTTIAGNVWWTGYFDAGSAMALEEGRIVVPPGYTHGVSITAPGSNTSMAISLNVAFYYFDTELV